MIQTPDEVPVILLRDEVREVLRGQGTGLHPDVRITLAALQYADDEGVAVLSPNALSRWCRLPGSDGTSQWFLAQRIDHLTEVGILAPGSTARELRSMIGRRGDRA